MGADAGVGERFRKSRQQLGLVGVISVQVVDGDPHG